MLPGVIGMNAGQIGIGEIGAIEVCIVEHGVGHINAGKVGAAKVPRMPPTLSGAHTLLMLASAKSALVKLTSINIAP